MKMHSYHTNDCVAQKQRAGPALQWLAGAVGVIAPLNVVPQIIKIFETQSVADVSLLTYVIVISTQLVWLAYARKLGLKPLLISSVVVILLSGVIVFQFAIY